MQNESMYGAFAVIKGVLTALVISVLFSIFFAVVLRVAPVPDKAVYPVNQTVKVLAAFLGALFFVRGEKGWRKGLLVGVLFFALSYVTFSTVGGTFALSPLVLAELVFTALGGVIGGILGVNLRR
ncbi:MAG: TIGR04086 family membrane protein [Clostridia bacterium]|nr:TIGR04086 family membrane protein [Clostridia bacterium]MBQ8446309.1 TIGR04086 family membrane protein [Clostridia bacterium]